jgi:hypothetical protein
VSNVPAMRAVLIALATSMVPLLRSRASLHLEILALPSLPTTTRHLSYWQLL